LRARIGLISRLFALVLAAPRVASADEEPKRAPEPDDFDLEAEAFGTRGLVRTRADTVSFDPKERSLELSGDVRIDSDPFHLRSQHIKLSRTRWGIEADGGGRLAFCPCLGTPLTIEFEKAIVAPPGELILQKPKLEVYGVPVMYLPWFWMRSAEKIGVLPPDLAYRGHDGFYVGDGVHLPWKDRGARESLDLRGGAYLVGGFVADARLLTPVGTTKVRWDRLRGQDGLQVDARGATQSVAWDADVLRGRRAVVMTTNLDAAAKPYDRASAAASLDADPIVAQAGYRAITRRGGDLERIDTSGPFVALRSSGGTAPGPLQATWDATVEGGALTSLRTSTLSYARGELGGLATTSFGPVVTSLSARGAGALANEADRSGTDATGAARVRFGLPLARAYEPADLDPHDRNDPIVHIMEPFAETGILYASGDALLGTLPGRGMAVVDGTAPITDAGFVTTIGRWAQRQALTIGASGGFAYGVEDPATTTALLRTRGAASMAFVGFDVESGHTKRGHAVTARARVGRADGLRVHANVAARDRIDPVLARALTDAPLEPGAGFLADTGTTGGAMLVVPWTRAITTSVGADGDANARELVAIRGGLDLKDRCGCVTLHANGSHRVGREGVDVWITLDFAPNADR
jgi:hypothetical protein